MPLTLISGHHSKIKFTVKGHSAHLNDSNPSYATACLWRTRAPSRMMSRSMLVSASTMSLLEMLTLDCCPIWAVSSSMVLPPLRAAQSLKSWSLL